MTQFFNNRLEIMINFGTWKVCMNEAIPDNEPCMKNERHAKNLCETCLTSEIWMVRTSLS